jgi:glucose-1-phosphate thymidylyltransferase
MQLAGITKAYIVLRSGKWDIPAYLGNGGFLGMDLAYLVMSLPYGTPYTLNQAYPFVKDAVVAFGFPDILFEPDDVFVRLLSRLESDASDVLIGLFPADRSFDVDMVEFDDSERVQRIIAKPITTELRYSWAAAVWRPAFTEFLARFVAANTAEAASQPELSVGDVLQRAIQEGLRVSATVVSTQPYIDIGTPEGLQHAAEIVSS